MVFREALYLVVQQPSRQTAHAKAAGLSEPMCLWIQSAVHLSAVLAAEVTFENSHLEMDDSAVTPRCQSELRGCASLITPFAVP